MSVKANELVAGLERSDPPEVAAAVGAAGGGCPVGEVRRGVGGEHVPVRLPDGPERPAAVAHGGPVLSDGSHAPERELEHHLQRAFGRGRAGEVRVQHVGGGAADEPSHGPARGEALLHLALGLDGAARRGELHQEHAEGVDVAAVRELARLEVLRVQVPRRALHLGGHVRRLPGGAGAQAGAEAREAEIGHLGAQRVGEEDVGGLDVAVDDGVVGVHVQVRDGVRDVDGDVETRPEVQEPPVAPCLHCIVLAR